MLPDMAAVTATPGDQAIQTPEIAEQLSASTPPAIDAELTVVPEMPQSAEVLPEAAIPQASAATAVAESPEAAPESELEAAHVNDEGEADSEQDESLTMPSPAAGEQPDLDAAPLPEEEIDSGQELEPPEGSEAGGDATDHPQPPRAHRRRSSTWQRRPEPSSEYTAFGLSALSSNYRTWNRALAEHLLLKGASPTELYLTITPRILARALMEVDGTTEDAEKAQAHFANAVSEMYRGRVLGNRARLRTLRRVGDDGLPECVAFLALTVLAAYRMHGDDEATGLAYYLRLSELLRTELSGQYPLGFDPIVFESLWHFLKDWLAQRGGDLAMPAPETGSRRFVGLPLAHVPLRSLDIDKLPDFFVWAGYQPSGEITLERIAEDFARWVRARGALTPTGAAAFADARRSAVLAQIRAEFDSWDGTCEESASRRSASVEILFDPVQSRPDLFYLPRRPLGFPVRFSDGARVFEGSDDGWYGRASIAPQDGPDLANGFIWQASHSGVEFALRRTAASAISLTPSDNYSYSGFMSARGLRKNVRCAVLCQEDIAQAVAEYLSHVAERQCTPFRHQSLPAGWSLFAGVLARRLAKTPAGLESLDVQTNVGLIPSGGIRLGNRWAWLQGAAPRIVITGSEPGLPVTIDGNPTAIAVDGLLQSEGSLTGVGTHVIQVGALRRTIEIVEPSLHMNSGSATESTEERAPAVLALPSGSWIVVGSTPGQVARPRYAIRQGVIVECNFAPAWAIRISADRGTTVLSVCAGAPPAPASIRGKTVGDLSSRVIFDWTSAIYSAAVRHPRIESVSADGDPVALAASWKAFAQCASQIKRTIRVSRR
ncbi:MAG: hypothetical protein AB7I36_19025 [Rhodospirillaceae bacterium]